MPENFVPVSAVEIGDAEEARVLAVLRSGQIAQGPVVAELEDLFAEICEVPHAVAVNSGTTALIAALQALGVGPGDEVITSPLTFVASLNAILAVGATARFCDVHPDGYTLDPAGLAELAGPRTRAVMPVHLYGEPADMVAISAFCRERGLAIVEDAAQAHGARCHDQSVGSFGIGCFSLYATKNVTSGEGGIITTSDATLARTLRLLRNQGMETRYEYEIVGWNYRLTDLQAAVAVPQIERLENITRQRQQNAAMLTAGLRDVPGLVVPQVRPNRTHVYHQYTVRVTSAARCSRSELAEALECAGIGSGIYYPRVVFEYPCFTESDRVHHDLVPNARQVSGEVISLPVHSALTTADLERVIEATRSALT